METYVTQTLAVLQRATLLSTVRDAPEQKTEARPIARASSNVQGFSLIELLVVLAVMSIMATLAAPVLKSLMVAGKLSLATSGVSSVLTQARSYAMAKNTYVYVGIQEVDGVQPSSSNGIGDLAVAVVASLDGARPYTSTSGSLATSDITLIEKPQLFSGVHLTSSASLSNGAIMTSRPSASVDLSGATAATTFQWPLSGPSKYSFTKVIEFDPQGVARVQANAQYSPSIQSYLEVPLVPANGDAVSSNISDQAAVQVDGVTGAVTIYRP
jgi:prepilin-type N-terminal cleavage/methylation domain-containing protein